jgi:hypothetical protein
MSQLTQSPIPFLVACLVVILAAFWGGIAWTTRVSFRLDREWQGSLKRIPLLALLQVALGVGAVVLLRAIHNDPLLDLGVGLGVVLLSGLFLMKWFFARPWKATLRIWVVAAAQQFILLPVSGVVLGFLLIMLLTVIFPPQY